MKGSRLINIKFKTDVLYMICVYRFIIGVEIAYKISQQVVILDSDTNRVRKQNWLLIEFMSEATLNLDV